MGVTLEDLTTWLERYFAAWRSNKPADVAVLFAENAVYYYGPFKDPAVGRDTIVQRWVSDPEEQRDLRISYTPLAVNANRGVAHWQVSFRPGKTPDVRITMDGILVLTFDAEGRCIEHREWYALKESS